MTVILYTAPGCGPCAATKRALRVKLGDDFDIIDLSEDEGALEFVRGTLGYQSAPVVYVDAEQHWSGFEPDRIKNMIVGRDPSLA